MRLYIHRKKSPRLDSDVSAPTESLGHQSDLLARHWYPRGVFQVVGVMGDRFLKGPLKGTKVVCCGIIELKEFSAVLYMPKMIVSLCSNSFYFYFSRYEFIAAKLILVEKQAQVRSHILIF